MQKMTISCQLCGKIISIVEKSEVTDQDLNEAIQTSSCEDDGSVIMQNGQPNIVAVKTKDIWV